MNSKFFSLFLIFLIIVLTSVSIFLWNKNINQGREFKEIKSIKADLQYNYELLAEEYEKLNNRFNAYQKFQMNRVALDYPHIKNMKKKGLDNPIQNLIEDLKSHPELIPEKGTLGGIMGFKFDEKIWILTNKWALAYFEDGHTGGYLLLEYIVKNDGKIVWKIMSSQTI